MGSSVVVGPHTNLNVSGYCTLTLLALSGDVTVHNDSIITVRVIIKRLYSQLSFKIANLYSHIYTSCFFCLIYIYSFLQGILFEHNIASG